MDKLALKKRILEESTNIQRELRDDLRQASQERLQSTDQNDDDDFTDRYESTREEVLDEIGQVAPQTDAAEYQLQLLNRIDTDTLHDQVTIGSVVLTDSQQFFVSTSLPKFRVDGQEYIGVSTESPVYQAMKGKKKGDTFALNGVKYHIEDVF
jgi:transcription elongation GreA/GreB family factor